MKYFLLLCLFSSPVYAKETYQSLNSVGGAIILTDNPCNGVNSYIIYATKPNSPTIFGCYTRKNDSLLVKWQHGLELTLNINDFTKMRYF